MARGLRYIIARMSVRRGAARPRRSAGRCWCAGAGGPGVRPAVSSGRNTNTRKRSTSRSTARPTVVVNTSMAALVALRGAPSFDDGTPASIATRCARFFQSPVTDGHPRQPAVAARRPPVRPGARGHRGHPHARQVGRRSPGRRTRSTPRGRDGAPSSRRWARPAAATPGGRWNGSELVAVRLHVPAKIQFHNAPSNEVERGNIVSWEQPLKDRLAGQPLRVEVRMERNIDPRLDADDLRRVRGRRRDPVRARDLVGAAEGPSATA